VPNLRILLTVAFLVAISLPPRSEGAAPAFRVIVHPDNLAGSIDHKLLQDVFLRRATHWSDGQAINPVDLPPNSPVRSRFSSEALRRTVDSVKTYWLQALFSGRSVPPPELSNDEQVVTFVARTAGAIGYVSDTAKLGSTRIIEVR
jgi:ABC-type phosphate transport system substrate-binding protein